MESLTSIGQLCIEISSSTDECTNPIYPKLIHKDISGAGTPLINVTWMYSVPRVAILLSQVGEIVLVIILYMNDDTFT